MNKYKLIVSDFDGTLAGKEEVMSGGVVSAIKRWIESDLDFSIATGKSYPLIRKDIKILGLTAPQVVRGGAEIVDPKGEKVIYSHLIDKDTVKSIMDFMLENKFGLIIEEGSTFYSNYQHRYLDNKEISSLSLEEFESRPIPKIVVSLMGKNLEEADKLLEEMRKKYPELNFAKSYSPLGKAWDVTSLKATKHLAVLELIKILGVPREQTVGVGDGYNDFPLLEACGFKVAMGNSPEDLKAIADLIVPSYQEDGVAVLIEKLLSV